MEALETQQMYGRYLNSVQNQKRTMQITYDQVNPQPDIAITTTRYTIILF